MATPSDLLSALLQALRDNTAALSGLSADQENLTGTVRDLRAAIERLTAVVDRRLAVDEDRDKQSEQQRRAKMKFFEKLFSSKPVEMVLRLLVFGVVGTDLGLRIWPIEPKAAVEVTHADVGHPSSISVPDSGSVGDPPTRGEPSALPR
jgi:hypothetical protein